MNCIADVVSGKQLDYSELMKSCSDTSYLPFGTFANPIDFVTNFIKALVSGNDITLIDSDFSPHEIESLGLTDAINVPFERKGQILSNWGEVVELIEKSGSTIHIFTSGTTGLPKKIEHNVGSLTRLVRKSEKYSSNIWAWAYNPTHMAGIQVLFQAILNGNTLVNVFGADAVQMESAFAKYQISHISATPTFYRMLTATKESFESVKRITLGGEKSDELLYKRLGSLFPNAKINNIYASTELGSLLVSNGNAFRIPDGMEKDIKIEDNELKIKAHYLGPNHSSEDWYATGDNVEVLTKDPLTFIFVGRKTDIINVGGYKANPSEIEEVMTSLEGIFETKVYGKSNSVLGNILCADVVLSENSTLTKKEITDFCKSKLQDYKVPRMVKIVDEISTTRTGKKSRL